MQVIIIYFSPFDTSEVSDVFLVLIFIICSTNQNGKYLRYFENRDWKKIDKCIHFSLGALL